jgi:hypothetical protein
MINYDVSRSRNGQDTVVTIRTSVVLLGKLCEPLFAPSRQEKPLKCVCVS